MTHRDKDQDGSPWRWEVAALRVPVPEGGVRDRNLEKSTLRAKGGARRNQRAWADEGGEQSSPIPRSCRRKSRAPDGRRGRRGRGTSWTVLLPSQSNSERYSRLSALLNGRGSERFSNLHKVTQQGHGKVETPHPQEGAHALRAQK